MNNNDRRNPNEPRNRERTPDDEIVDSDQREGGPAGPDGVADDAGVPNSRRSGDMDRPEMDPEGEGTGGA